MSQQTSPRSSGSAEKTDGIRSHRVISLLLIYIICITLNSCVTTQTIKKADRNKTVDLQLKEAVEAMDTKKVEQALNNGASPNTWMGSVVGSTALHIAALKGDNKTVEL